ncbi:fluoride efflux transporter CrcB [Acidipila sp. EB88]|uniref:fluoride efflux transporter CrcB n=1 Tax=Acidipila sp. EB88 TaxID=2305226 RepID=UPI0013154720|nr:fluoride efflux transporter CrcB [Acidipila sp. EB88]
MELLRYLLVAVGGGCGSMLRYFIGARAAEHFGPAFPVGTLSINLMACFVIGLVLQFLSLHAEINPEWRFLIATGFIGGFSTFSTFEWEAWSDLASGRYWVGLVYIAVSLVGGLVAVSIGVSAAKTLSRT